MRRIVFLSLIFTMSGVAFLVNVSGANAAALSAGCDLFNNPVVDGTYNNLGVTPLPFFRGETITITLGRPLSSLLRLSLYRHQFQWGQHPLQSAPISGSGAAVITYSFPADTSTDTEWRLVGGLLSNTATWDLSCTALEISTQASSSSSLTATSSATITDTVTLAGGVNPTGTLTFSLFGPDNATCAGTPVFTDTETVAGNGVYTSDPFAAAAPGA